MKQKTFHLRSCLATCLLLLAGSVSVSAQVDDAISLTGPASDGSYTFDLASGKNATVFYKVVRDIAQQVTATVGDGRDLLIVEKDGSDWKLKSGYADNLSSVYDDLLDASLVGDDFDYALQKKSGATWSNVSMDYSPGLYRYKITGKGNYGGTLYKEFELSVGLPVTVPAKGYITVCNSFGVKSPDESIVKLYKVSAVNETTGEVTAHTLVSANAAMPFIVANKTNVEQSVALLPADDVQQTWSENFKGTLVEKTFTDADLEDNSYYVLTRSTYFVWVNAPGTIAAGKCWIELPKTTYSARQLVLSFDDETTGIRTVDSGQRTADSYYDLNGRKLLGMPTQKGVYIKNGSKVVIK